MNHFILTVNIVLPIFMLMAVGFFCRRIGWINEANASALNKIVFRLFLPASLCKSLMNMTGEGLNWMVLLIGFIGTLTVFALGFLIIPRIEPENPRRAVMIQGLFRSNYAIFGVALLEVLCPEGDGGLSAMMVIVVVPLYNMLGVLTLEWFRGGKADIRSILKGIMKNPLIWGCIVGVVLMLLPVKIPEFMLVTIDKLASVSTPLALFALGAALNLHSLGKNGKALAIVTIARLVVVPGVILLIAYLLGMRGAEFAVLMIAFGTPCAVSSYTMSSQMGGDGELAAQQVMLTTILSSVTMFIMIFAFKSMGIL